MIYLDAATTVPTNQATRQRLSDVLENTWGNVSGAHSTARKAKSLLEDGRERLANICGVAPDSVVFTSGATEAINLAIQGFNRAHPQPRIFYSSVEHPAVLKTCRSIEDSTKIVEISVNENGIINTSDLNEVQSGDLVCVMAVNNEIGVVNDIEKISEIVHEKGAYLLVDAVQAFYSFLPSELCSWADFVVYSGHKLGSPQGVGVLIATNRKLISALCYGGSQEWELRPGTTPAFLCDAFVGVFEKRTANRAKTIEHLQACNKFCASEIESELPNAQIHVKNSRRAPHIIGVNIQGIESQILVTMLDSLGICISRGSACASGAATPSPVLLALGFGENQANSTIRLSFYEETTKDEIKTAISQIAECVDKLSGSSNSNNSNSKVSV